MERNDPSSKIKEIKQRRKNYRHYTECENEIIKTVFGKMKKYNLDNISRTKAYIDYYERNKEIYWAFLASMVSRNAGWHMTDLEGKWFPQVLSKKDRQTLFMTYERANWLIFNDAFPQLLIYQYSKQVNKPLFYLLKEFSVSAFIEAEWEIFWKDRAKKRLMEAQIINEQNIIQQPVIDNRFFKKKVFSSLNYKMQDFLHFSSVLFPSLRGELYGFSVHDFRQLKQRILLGRKLAWLLFHEKYYHHFYSFSKQTEHTGSRYDYEQYFITKTGRQTPFLRTTFPIIHHQKPPTVDWYDKQGIQKNWYKRLPVQKNFHITEWYTHKQKQLHLFIILRQLL